MKSQWNESLNYFYTWVSVIRVGSLSGIYCLCTQFCISRDIQPLNWNNKCRFVLRQSIRNGSAFVNKWYLNIVFRTKRNRFFRLWLFSFFFLVNSMKKNIPFVVAKNSIKLSIAQHFSRMCVR